MRSSNLFLRYSTYVLGLFVMTLGIAVSVKSDLGVSPISSIPYTMTCVWGIEMGKATIVLHISLVILQILLLRKRFKKKNLFQVPVGIVFGYLTTFSNYLMTYLPPVTDFTTQLALMVFSTLLIALGIFIYVPMDMVPLAGEGFVIALAKVTHKSFPRTKVLSDSTMVIMSLICCLCIIGSLGSVGIGTLAAAILVGNELHFLNEKLRHERAYLRAINIKRIALARKAHVHSNLAMHH